MARSKALVRSQDRRRLVRLATELPQTAMPLDEALKLVLQAIERTFGWSGGRVAQPDETVAADGRIRLPILAEERPLAVLELHPTTVAAERAEVRELLELLAGQLSLIAGQQRMRQAVRQAARHVRKQQVEVPRASEGVRLYDPDTGLPEEALLADRIQQAVRRRQRSPRNQFAVVALEVDGFEQAPSSARLESVDDLRRETLHTLGRRLLAQCRPADTVARRGVGFAVVLEAVRSNEEAMQVAERLRREAQRRLSMGGGHLSLDAYAGVVLGSTAYDNPKALLSDADAALARARRGDDHIQLFDAGVEATERKRRLIETELANAAKNSELYLEFQPIVALADGRISGLEAFIRWRHPEMGLVPPADFVPVAESSPLIFEIGNWVLEETCAQVRRWLDRLAPRAVPPVAVNVTARQLFHPEFLTRVREILEHHALSGSQVRFDVSETIRVAMDDFGTGYSSLSLLHSLPISALKIDRSFISRPRERLRKWGVARTIVELAKILDLEVIAEGIETREQFLELRSAGCHQAQGFHFAGPVGPPQAEEFIRDGYPLDLEAPVR